MKMPQATEADKEAFRDLVADLPGAEVKPMFGQLGAFVNGNMFAGLFGSSVGLKLDADAAEELTALGGGPFGPQERPMGGYLTIPDGLADDERARWVARALEHVATFPPKRKK